MHLYNTPKHLTAFLSAYNAAYYEVMAETDKLWYEAYYEQDGSPRWPDNGGFDDPIRNTNLPVGTYVDRYGSSGGRYASPEMTPFEQRSLPFGSWSSEYHVYRTTEQIPVYEGGVAPAFGQPGWGTQYYFFDSIQELLNAGSLEEVYIIR